MQIFEIVVVLRSHGGEDERMMVVAMTLVIFACNIGALII